MKIFAFGMGLLAIGLLIAAVRFIVKGRMGAAVGTFVVAVVIGALAGFVAAS